MHPIPDGYHTLTPYLVVSEAESMVRFLQEGFGARLLERYNRPDGTLQHSVFQFGVSRLLMAQASEQYAAMRLNTLVYVEDVDAVFAKAVAAGAKVLLPLSNQPYGDRMCGLEDPAGNVWWVATHQENPSPEKTAGK
ncbi:MAG: VOC family protein [Acidobacteriota bacterium]|nr:VOC family protein [Acidobacteriota bacterium]